MPRGGARPGAGRKKGKAMLDREIARTQLREMVIAANEPLVRAQIANAIGIKYLVRRDDKGKFTPLSEDQFKEAFAKGEAVELYEKVPNVQAFDSLMDRTYDKPTQHVDMKADLTISGKADRILAARNRTSGKR
jgi:hypothetical protein